MKFLNKARNKLQRRYKLQLSVKITTTTVHKTANHTPKCSVNKHIILTSVVQNFRQIGFT